MGYYCCMYTAREWGEREEPPCSVSEKTSLNLLLYFIFSCPFLSTCLSQNTQITKILKTNTRVCGALGPMYIAQLSTIFMDVLKIYQYYSENISQAVAEQVFGCGKAFHSLSCANRSQQ